LSSTTEAVKASVADQQLAAQSPPAEDTTVDGPYAKYVLAILVLMGVLNFIDRQIFAILAEEIKADLGLSDGDLGFLFGTAFAVFYAIFGIPLGRLADSWTRTKQISLSVGFWSLMTALSGLTKSFLPLAVCRFGVAVGEAGATPSAYSLLYDYFSPKTRTTVMGVYGAGVSIGAGIGLFLGGAILGAWSNAWPDPSLAPFGLKGWQAAFMVVGLPGILLSLLIWTLKEPLRGGADAVRPSANIGSIAPSPATHPVRTLIMEIIPMLPGINLWLLQREGAGPKAQLLNLGMGIGIVLAATGLIQLTGDTLQWLALGIGLYCAFSWAQVLICRDPVCFGLIVHCKTVRYLFLFFGLNAFASVAVGFWSIPWFQRYFGLSAMEVGTMLGLSYAVVGLIGMVMGGVLADWLRQRTRRGKLYVALGSVVFWLLATVFMLSAESVLVAYAATISGTLVGTMVAAPVSTTVTDLVLPRIRAITMALFILVMNFMGVALGPYCVGLLSDSLTVAGTDSGEALRYSMQWGLVISGISIVFLLLATKHVVADEDSLLDRARALGEDV
jgi:MFS family permease